TAVDRALVVDCETIMAGENEAWMAEFLRGPNASATADGARQGEESCSLQPYRELEKPKFLESRCSDWRLDPAAARCRSIGPQGFRQFEGRSRQLGCQGSSIPI